MEALTALAATGEPLSAAEVQAVYLPLLSFLLKDVEAVRTRQRELRRLMGIPDPHVP